MKPQARHGEERRGEERFGVVTLSLDRLDGKSRSATTLKLVDFMSALCTNAQNIGTTYLGTPCSIHCSYFLLRIYIVNWLT